MVSKGVVSKGGGGGVWLARGVVGVVSEGRSQQRGGVVSKGCG